MIYTNLEIKSFTRKPKVLFAEDNNDIERMKKEIVIMEEQLSLIGEEINAAFSSSNIEVARTLSSKYNLSLQSYFKLNSALVTLYENKIKKLESNEGEIPISMSQKEQIAKEMKEMEKICCLGVKEDPDVAGVFKRNIFGNLLEKFEEKCPLLFDLLQTLLLTDSRKRVHKTPEYKLTCGVNTLALLLNVRNQKCNNDIRLLFGLICITYGAGKQFVNLLNAMGLSPHWDTLYVLPNKLSITPF